MDSGSMIISGFKGLKLNLTIQGAVASGKHLFGELDKVIENIDTSLSPYVEKALTAAKASRAPIEGEINFLSEWLKKYVEEPSKEAVDSTLKNIADDIEKSQGGTTSSPGGSSKQ